MTEVSVSPAVIGRICEQLTDDPATATGEVMAAAALVAISAGLQDDQAVAALKTGLTRIRDAEKTAVN